MIENNPFPDSPPEALRFVDEGLYQYLVELTRLSREAYDKNLYGQAYLSEEILNTFYNEEIYTLGAVAVILHNTYGPMTCKFVKFDQMITTPLGHPVGIPNDNNSITAWTVTNDIRASSSSNAFGLLGASRIPADGEYGWVITSGPNPYPIILDLEPEVTTSIGIGLSWQDDGVVGALTTFGAVQGANLGRQIILGNFEIAMPAGSFVVTQDSDSITTIQSGLQAQIDHLSLELGETNATVATNKLAQIDGDESLGIRIDAIEVNSGGNSAAITEESSARAAGDNALAQQVTELDASLSSGITAAVSQEASARVEGDTALASQVTTVESLLSGRIDVNQQSAAKATTAITALTKKQEASIVSETRLEASLKEGSAENLLATNAESLQTGPFVYSNKTLLSSVGLFPGESISFGGDIYDPAPHNAEDAGWEIEFFDQMNNSVGTAESNLVNFAELSNGEFAADSTLVTADSTFFTADMAGAAHHQLPRREDTVIPGNAYSFTFRGIGGTDSADTQYGPVTLVRGPVLRAFNKVTSYATATETLEARVGVNEEGLVVAFAKWAVVLDVDGRVAGLELINGSQIESAFRVLVDKFQVFNGTTDEAVFEVNGGVAQMKAANIANLDASKITTGELLAGIVNASNINAGTLNADRINLDGLTLDTDGAGKLIVKAAGVDTAQLADNAATKISYAEDNTTKTLTTTSVAMASVTTTYSAANTVLLECMLQIKSDVDVTIEIIITQSSLGIALITEHRIFGGGEYQLVSYKIKRRTSNTGNTFAAECKKQASAPVVEVKLANITITEFKK